MLKLIFFLPLYVLTTSGSYCSDSSTTITLNDGNRIPRVSYGTLGRVSDHYLIKPAVIEAITAGFRQIDTAAMYENEEYVGEAIAYVIEKGIVKREDLWITTKLNFTVGNRDAVVSTLQESLQRLKLDYVDLYMIYAAENVYNVPDYDFLSVWKGMEDAQGKKLTRSIGVSNFQSSDINRILANSKTVPTVNEIEASVTYANLDTIAYCQEQNITVLAYAPFGFLVPRPFIDNQPREVTFKTKLLTNLAEKYGKTSSQIVLRYLVDRNIIPIPRSTNTKHINLNIDIFDFRLTQQEIYLINELNLDERVYTLSGEIFVATAEYFYS